MYEDDDFDELEPKSKTQIKKEMQALQELGVAITKLTPAQRAKIPMSESLRDAIDEANSITSNSASKRHRQFIGKLIRREDYEAMERAYLEIQETAHRVTRQQHLVEKWRDTLIADSSQMGEFLNHFQQADRQQLRHLIQATLKEKEQNKPPTNYRKLFRFLRDTIDAHHSSNEN